MPTELLHCQLGDHPWNRERKRGRKPTSCPEHAAEAEQAKQAQRVTKISENVNTRMIERIERALENVPLTDTHLGVEIVHRDREVLSGIAWRISEAGMLRSQKDEDGKPESVDHILAVARERLRPYESRHHSELSL